MCRRNQLFGNELTMLDQPLRSLNNTDHLDRGVVSVAVLTGLRAGERRALTKHTAMGEPVEEELPHDVLSFVHEGGEGLHKDMETAE